jgi:ComF family protein
MHSFYKYEGIVRKAILKLKYNFASSIAEELIEACSINPSLSSYLLHTTCYLIPIPLHKKRHNWRGFNQAVLIGKKLSENSKWDFEENLLLRVEDTTPQVRLDKKERLQNIRGKFAVNNETLSVILERADKQAIESQPTFIVFDDVWTTGATINEAGKVLKKAGAKVVWGMSVARS